MAKATKARRKKRPISLSSTDTYTAAEYLTGILRSRTLAYVVAQPPSFLFIVCLLLIVVLLPFLAIYVQKADQIPDLDTMMKWKSFTGNLRKESFCMKHGDVHHNNTIGVLPPLPAWCGNDTLVNLTAGVEVKLSSHGHYRDSNEVWYTLLYGSEIGKDVDDCVTVRMSVPLMNASSCSKETCQACLEIRLPSGAKHVKDVQTGNKPALNCPHYTTNSSTQFKQLYLQGKSSCGGVGHIVEEYRQHGIVLVYLSEEEQTTSGHRLYLCAGLALLAAVVFGILSSIMDQPRDRRLGNE